MGIFQRLIDTQIIYEGIIVTLTVLFTLLYFFLYRAYSQLKKDVKFLNDSLSDHFLKPNEFIVHVDDNHQLNVRNPRGDFSIAYYHLLLICHNKKNATETES